MGCFRDVPWESVCGDCIFMSVGKSLFFRERGHYKEYESVVRHVTVIMLTRSDKIFRLWRTHRRSVCAELFSSSKAFVLIVDTIKLYQSVGKTVWNVICKCYVLSLRSIWFSNVLLFVPVYITYWRFHRTFFISLSTTKAPTLVKPYIFTLFVSLKTNQSISSSILSDQN